MSFNSKKRKHSKPGQTTMRAFHFRIETNNAQNTKLHHALDLAWELRNDQATLLDVNRQEGRQARLRGETPAYLSAFDLKKTVASDQIHPKFRALHSQVRQAISLRISEGMKRWFDAIKAGRTVRFQRPSFLTLQGETLVRRHAYYGVPFVVTTLHLEPTATGC
jgi:hypothetical protein